MGRTDARSRGTVTTFTGGAEITSEWSVEPVPVEDQMAAMRTLALARWSWPCLNRPGGNLVSNGREMGTWIAGHLYALAIYDELGLVVEIPHDMLAAVVAQLVNAGIVVSRESYTDDHVTLAVWVERTLVEAEDGLSRE